MSHAFHHHPDMPSVVRWPAMSASLRFICLALLIFSGALVATFVGVVGGGLAHAQATGGAAGEAGKILLALGDTKIVRKGQTLPATRGAALQTGDAVLTGASSNMQIRMSDGAVIALRPQTEFRIDAYQFNGKADGSEKAALSLVQGGVRAVTGVIGRENKDNLQVNTVAATIGVRGTGFNIVACEGGCFNADKTQAKPGLYALVFEGKVQVANEVTQKVYGIQEPVYVADKTTAAERLRQIPDFLRDPLAGQVNVPKKADSIVAPINSPVVAPREKADVVVGRADSALRTVGPVVIQSPPPQITSGGTIVPSTIYNLSVSDGSTVPLGSTNNFLQFAQVYPAGQVSPNLNTPADGLPPHSVNNTGLNPAGYSVTYTSGYISQFNLAYPTYLAKNEYGVAATNASFPSSQVPVNYSQAVAFPSYAPGSSTNPAQLYEGGNYNSVVSWGRWANGNVQQMGGWNNGNPITIAADNGLHFIVGQPTTNFAGLGTINFTLLATTTPTAVTGGQTWLVTGGNLSANFGTNAISGNLSLYTTQSAGSGNFNMAYTGTATSASNAISGTVSKINGTLPICGGGCAATGNTTFYGTGASAAGLAYSFNTGSNVVQGVAIYKK